MKKDQMQILDLKSTILSEKQNLLDSYHIRLDIIFLKSDLDDKSIKIIQTEKRVGKDIFFKNHSVKGLKIISNRLAYIHITAIPEVEAKMGQKKYLKKCLHFTQIS